jgi:serine/threonine protein kinase
MSTGDRARAASADPPKIGDYVVVSRLGQGLKGVVLKACDSRFGGFRAVRVLPESFSRDSAALTRLRRDIQKAVSLRHPNVVAIVDTGEDGSVHFVVMEFVEGRGLDRVVGDDGPVHAAVAVDYMIAAARGLEALHASGIIHGDIKPANLFLDARGTVRVLDVGLARLVAASDQAASVGGGRSFTSDTSRRRAVYMAPEYARNPSQADYRADIYSLGGTLHYLVTGRLLNEAPSSSERLMDQSESPAPSLRASRPEIPAKLDFAFGRMVAERAKDRPASMTEVIALLESCKAAFGGTHIAQIRPAENRALAVDDLPPRPEKARGQARDPSILVRREERAGLNLNRDLNLEDLLMDERYKARHKPEERPAERTSKARALTRSARPGRYQRNVVWLAAISLGALICCAVALVRLRFDSGGAERTRSESLRATTPNLPPSTSVRASNDAASTPRAPADEEFHTIFDGKSAVGWMLCDRRPVPPSSVQPDGLNSRGSGSYLVVYDEKLGDFELKFDYKLSKGCRTGVFVRVSDLGDPIHSGIAIAVNDTSGLGVDAPGAFAGLAGPKVNAQKPAGQWNRMTIRAHGPDIMVELNGSSVSFIDLDKWTVPGKRPDGSDHRFRNVAIARLARTGYLGFQDLGGDCWFNRIQVRRLRSLARPSTTFVERTEAPLPKAPARAH